MQTHSRGAGSIQQVHPYIQALLLPVRLLIRPTRPARQLVRPAAMAKKAHKAVYRWEAPRLERLSVSVSVFAL